MITAMTSSRIEAASRLEDIQVKLRSIRSYICFNNDDVVEIDNAILTVQYLVNKIMNTKYK